MLFNLDTNTTTLFNTNNEVIFVAKARLLQSLSNERMKKTFIFLKIKKSQVMKHESIQFVELFFFVIEENDKR